MTLRALLGSVTGQALHALFVMLSLGSIAGVPVVSAEPVMLGLYPPGAALTTQGIDAIADVDTWIAPTGKRVSIAGTFVTVEDDPAYVPFAMENAWSRGYTPFVNFKSRNTTTDIANGLIDGAIRAWAGEFALWARDGQRRAFIAPLPEMNGNWNLYYGPPAPFKQAYQRIRQLINEELANHGVSHAAVTWVFTANGWSLPGDEFENYYPGPDVVDVVSINSYNFGGCPGPSGTWDTYDVVLKQYLDRLPAMAPGKMIFVVETGTVEVPANGVGDKDQWLLEVFTKLAIFPNFRAVLYMNASEVRSTLPACPNGADYRLHVPGTSLWQGFWNAMAATPNYVYWAPDSLEMEQIIFGGAPSRISCCRDASGDGRADILWKNPDSGNIALWLMDGGTVVSSVALGNMSPWTVAGIADFDGDGKADILWQNPASGVVTLWRMNGGTVLSTTDFGNMSPWKVVGVGDFDGDGKADILWQNPASGVVALWRMNGGAVLGTTGFGNMSPWVVAGIGDLDGDGRADILWQNPASGVVSQWRMNGGAVLGTTGFGNMSPWRVVGVGDFDGDGKADILWKNPTSGVVSQWRMNGGAVLGTTGFGNMSPWLTVGVGDFNGDGRADILWRNPESGVVALWFMNGGTALSSTGFGNLSPWLTQ